MMIPKTGDKILFYGSYLWDIVNVGKDKDYVTITNSAGDYAGVSLSDGGIIIPKEQSHDREQ